MRSRLTNFLSLSSDIEGPGRRTSGRSRQFSDSCGSRRTAGLPASCSLTPTGNGPIAHCPSALGRKRSRSFAPTALRRASSAATVSTIVGPKGDDVARTVTSILKCSPTAASGPERVRSPLRSRRVCRPPRPMEWRRGRYRPAICAEAKAERYAKRSILSRHPDVKRLAFSSLKDALLPYPANRKAFRDKLQTAVTSAKDFGKIGLRTQLKKVMQSVEKWKTVGGHRLTFPSDLQQESKTKRSTARLETPSPEN